ncbi:hypothetical protein M3196_10155 [Fictibacillus nanhaiensis]|uniref:hypothetical protein n=1 Tax=Fictibacillus nanhaiensis TaxID=742169 RepID=UPI00204208B0|nr:hypothetical protein [Fictibacillus nanhaiensis]MCM3732020.1 hypothetical protein [Fictibacillus nanhaiensis]
MDKKIQLRKTEYERNLEKLEYYKKIMAERKAQGRYKEHYIEGVGIAREYGELNVRGLVERLLQSNYITG